MDSIPAPASGVGTSRRPQPWTTPGPTKPNLCPDADAGFGARYGVPKEELAKIFWAGKLLSMTAKSGLDRVKSLYNASEPGKDVFGIIDLGIDPNVKIVPGSRMVARMPAEMVTVQSGGNQWAGGESDSTFGLACFLTGATFKVDGKPIVQPGELKV